MNLTLNSLRLKVPLALREAQITKIYLCVLKMVTPVLVLINAIFILFVITLNKKLKLL